MKEPVPSPSEPPAAAAPERGLPSWPALVLASLVFGGFFGYGMLAPATYRTTAQIVLKPIDGATLELPAAPPAVERLRSAAVDDETLAQVAHELELNAGAQGRTAAKVHVDTELEVQSTAPGTFAFSFRAPSAQAAARVTNLLARHAAARAVRALSPPAPDENAGRETARSKNAAELAAFIAAHPELTPPAPSIVPVTGNAAERDPAALRAERDQIQAKLSRMPEGAANSDNPFGEAAANPEATRLRRRVAEIDQTLKARQKDKKPEPAPKIAPEVDREWKRLLQAVANPVVGKEPAATPAFTVLLRDAVQPTAPIKPNRRAVALAGAVASLATALLAWLVLRLFGRQGARAGTPLRDEFVNELTRPGSEPPRAGSEPPRPGSDPPRFGSEPPRPGSEPPRPGSEPPRAGSEPPRAGSEPPRAGSEPPRPGSNPDLGQTQPLRHTSDSPQQGSNPPIPIVAVGGNPAPAARVSSSNPPARAERSSAPPAEASVAATAAAMTSTVVIAPAATPVEPAAPPAPAPAIAPTVIVNPTTTKAPSPSPAPVARPTPGYEELRRPSADAAAIGTLVGKIPEARALDATLLATPSPSPSPSPAPPATEPFATTPSAREPAAPRSTMRPPPQTPTGPVVEATGEVVNAQKPGRASGDGERRPEPGQHDETWTGPSRAHRRSVSSAARRTTQMLGSPIPPVVRGSSSRPPATERPPNAPQTPPAPAGDGAATRYSYVSSRPEPPPRTPADTPPYYQNIGGAEARAPHGTSRSVPAGAAAPGPSRIVRHPARADWKPAPTIDFHARRVLSDQLFPLAVAGCFVVGVTAVPESRAHKARVAAELALALAEPRHPRVLLVEADFQWPMAHQVMNIEMPMSAGFSQQLRARAQGQRADFTVVECTPTLHVLGEGILRSPGQILSVQFEEALRTLRTYYDVIVIVGPDTGAIGESRALANVSDGVVIVAPAAGSAGLAHAAELHSGKAFSTVVGI